MAETDSDKLTNMRHSAAHLLAAAVQKLWPDVKLGVGPVIENGFYYDFDLDHKLSESDFEKIEKAMRGIQARGLTYEREEVSIIDAKQRLEEMNQPYKVELVETIEKTGTTAISDDQNSGFRIQDSGDEKVSFYKTGEFVDLCRGGHVDTTKDIGPFKLLSVAGAYWRGKSENPQLQRIYGTCWPTQEELDAYLKQLEEAKERDHRKIGKEMELFFIDEMVGKGLVMWLPNGTILRERIEALANAKEARDGYVRVVTPHIAKEELYLASGHLPYYKDSMYPGMKMDDGTYYLRAMNCPHHHRVFLAKPRSYRDLPLRLAEYGTVYRNELSGTLAGLLRVRGLAMNDAHMYCTKEQIKGEFTKVLKLIMEYFAVFGLENYWFRLSKWSPNHTEKYIDEPANWEYSEGVIREVLQELGVNFTEAEDEAAFYGPKVDVQFKSVIGREETMSTVQLDFAAKQRFGLEYTDEQGNKNNEVFVIHRAPLSTHERFLAFLIEHYAGKFPLWLAPVQIKLLPIADRHAEYATAVAEQLRQAGYRVEIDAAQETIGKKIRAAQLEKVPYMLILGDKEVEAGTVAVRGREAGDLGAIGLDELLKKLAQEPNPLAKL